MSWLDVFAWTVLIILLVSTVAVVVFLAMLPGMIAKKRNHPWAQAVTVAGWVTLFLGFALWPVVLIWAYVDIPRVQRAGEAAS
jgi:Kef-type K+ transport system membrane component KefB